MSYKITFDRLRICVPNECVTIYDESVFTTTISGGGKPIRAKFEQTFPFYYSIVINHAKKFTDIEFSGKALLEDYPALINHTNITTCFSNISRCGVCFIDSTKAVNTAYVKQCDVTCDIASSFSIKDLYKSITLSSSMRWCLRDVTSNRFTVESTNTTKRCKSRCIVYDKEKDMARRPNQNFLAAVANPDEQIEHFRGKIRYELNLNSINRIQHYFNITETRLSTLLYSNTDPIVKFLGEAVKDDDRLKRAVELSPTIRDLEHLLLLAICDYNLNKVELLIRDMYGTSRSITRCKEPYINLLVRLKDIIPEPMNNKVCSDISSHLKHMLSLLNDANHTAVPNLISMYNSSKLEVSGISSCAHTNTTLFNIDCPQLSII
ncbi:MAG: hypothetical protein K2I64_03795 [Muribaculaceae bacterium]|nr:hypothetical protein [Muribaculaceae bacterium]